MTAREALYREFEAHAADNYLHVDVLGEGPTSAEVIIIGEGPGQQEVRTGSPFTGGAGRMLWDNLRRIGIHRGNCYVTNVVKRQISLSRQGNEKHIVHRDELQKWIGLLKWELTQLPNIKTIIVLGNYALEAVLGFQGITNWRGSVVDVTLIDGRNVKAVCSINPAYALRDKKQEPFFQMDCQKIGRVVTNTWKEFIVEAHINPSYSDVLRYIHDVKLARRPTGFDVEIINGETACYGLANDAHFGMCINLRDHARNRFTVQQEADILLALQDLFKEFKLNSVPLIGQNGMFDSYWTWLHDYLRIDFSHDTLLAHHTLYPTWPHNLGFLTTQYTNLAFYKDEGKRWREGGDIDSFWKYNVKDCCVLIPIFKREVRELKEQGLYEFFYQHVMRLQPHCVAATVHGVAVDMEAKEEAIEVSGRDLAASEAETIRLMRECTGNPEFNINLRSTQQLKDLFFNQLKLEGRGKSTDKHNREKIKKNAKTPTLAKEMLASLDRFKEEATFHGNFATSRVSDDGRFRAEFKQYGVVKAPGRLSSKQLITGEGGNFQNQPPRARNMYVADGGCCFIYFDLKQAEAQVVAYRANIPSWKEQFEKTRKDGSYDCHRALAADMFHIKYDDVPKKDFIESEEGKLVFTKRYIAKRCRHGLNYRMEIDKLAEVTKLPYHEARLAYQLYHKLTPELRRWWEAQIKAFRQDRLIYNALGRRFKVIQRFDDDVMDSIIAFYPQSTIGDKVSQVWYMAEEDDKWPKTCRVAINVHDSLTGLGPLPQMRRGVMVQTSDAMRALSILKKYAETPIMVQNVYNDPPEPLIIPAELKMSTTTVKPKKGKPYEDTFHRWSNMVDVEV